MVLTLTATLLAVIVTQVSARLAGANLRPQESATRTTYSLDGLWAFKADFQNVGFNEGAEWYKNQFSPDDTQVIEMPVPSSFNDITQDLKLREFVGVVWYQHKFSIPFIWSSLKNTGHRIYLRFESAHYYAQVYWNGNLVVEHDGGHLPFEADITDYVEYGKSAILTVAVNNTLTVSSLPPGSVTQYSGGAALNYQMDFFNYAGIHRAVKLYTVPSGFVSDITLVTDFEKDQHGSIISGIVQYEVELSGIVDKQVRISCSVLDHNEKEVASIISGQSRALSVNSPTLWWPVGMSPVVGYLYFFQVSVLDSQNNVIDVYTLKFGFRTVRVTSTQFLINDKPFYFHGAAKHEDAFVRGKGFDWPTVIKDFNLISWLGMNSFRTSHYPYASEILDECDKHGIVVIDESPGVGILTHNLRNDTLKHHKIVMEEIVRRDKNHPSVVMWSVANEPDSNAPLAAWYFSEVISHTKSLDHTRPVTCECRSIFSLI